MSILLIWHKDYCISPNLVNQLHKWSCFNINNCLKYWEYVCTAILNIQVYFIFVVYDNRMWVTYANDFTVYVYFRYICVCVFQVCLSICVSGYPCVCVFQVYLCMGSVGDLIQIKFSLPMDGSWLSNLYRQTSNH